MKRFAVHPASVILWLWLLVVLGVVQALSYLFAIVVHEVGHAFVAKRLGYRLSRFSISPYGVELGYFGQNLDCQHEIKIALAGPLFNFVSAFLVVGLWWIFPTTYFFTASFVQISVLLALINLLPAYPLDGGRVFIGLSSHLLNGKLAKKITVVVNLILSALFFSLFFVFLFINFNPSYLLFAVFLVIGVLDLQFVTRFEKVNIFCKEFKNFVNPSVVCVNADVKLGDLISKIQLSKTHIFLLVLNGGRVVTLSEKMVVALSTKFGTACSLGEIFGRKIDVRTIDGAEQ